MAPTYTRGQASTYFVRGLSPTADPDANMPRPGGPVAPGPNRHARRAAEAKQRRAITRKKGNSRNKNGQEHARA